jgi:hypothetical protein
LKAQQRLLTFASFSHTHVIATTLSVIPSVVPSESTRENLPVKVLPNNPTTPQVEAKTALAPAFRSTKIKQLICRFTTKRHLIAFTLMDSLVI